MKRTARATNALLHHSQSLSCCVVPRARHRACHRQSARRPPRHTHDLRPNTGARRSPDGSGLPRGPALPLVPHPDTPAIPTVVITRAEQTQALSRRAADTTISHHKRAPISVPSRARTRTQARECASRTLSAQYAGRTLRGRAPPLACARTCATSAEVPSSVPSAGHRGAPPAIVPRTTECQE